MGRWYAAEPRLVGADFIHPMPAGAKIVGELFTVPSGMVITNINCDN